MKPVILLITIFAAGCTKSKLVCTPSPIPIFLRLVNTSGQNLLDPLTPGAYDSSAITVIGAGISSKAYPHNSLTADSIFLELPIFENVRTGSNQFFIKLNNNDTDTIQVEQRLVDEQCGGYELTGFRYNGVTFTKSLIGSTGFGPIKGFAVVK